MQIFHRAVLRVKASDKKALDDFGIEISKSVPFPMSKDTLAVFIVDAVDPRWPPFSEWAKQRRVTLHTSTRFSPQDIKAADWFKVDVSAQKGQPQPKYGFLERYYDLSAYCSECRTGHVQNAPFRLWGEPKIANRPIFKPIWVYDAYFVETELWKTAFQPLGIGAGPVLDRKGKTLQNIVQLEIAHEVNVKPGGAWKCPNCDRISFLHHYIGPFPAFTVSPDIHIAQTRQIFGGAGLHWPYLVMSKTLRKSLIAHKVSGIGYWPVDNGSIK